MRIVLDLRALLAAALAFLALAGPTQAGIINGSFEDTPSLTAWDSSLVGGTVSAIGSTPVKGGEPVKGGVGNVWSPTDGNYFALLAGNGDNTTQSIFQVFNTTESGTLSFDYFFDSAEGDAAYPDSFRLQIGEWNGSAFTTLLFDEFHDVASLNDPPFSGPSGNTGWLSESISLLAGRTYRVFGVLENLPGPDQHHGGVEGADYNSIAGLDNFRFQADPPAVPEPASMTLLGLGVLGLAWRRRRRAAKVAETTDAN